MYILTVVRLGRSVVKNWKEGCEHRRIWRGYGLSIEEKMFERAGISMSNLRISKAAVQGFDITDTYSTELREISVVWGTCGPQGHESENLVHNVSGGAGKRFGLISMSKSNAARGVVGEWIWGVSGAGDSKGARHREDRLGDGMGGVLVDKVQGKYGARVAPVILGGVWGREGAFTVYDQYGRRAEERCGTLVDGSQCSGCALLRKKFKEDLFTYCVENGIFQDLQDTFESSDDNTNVVNAPQEPFVVKQDPGNPQSPPHIDHQVAKDRYWKIPICYDDDEDDTIAIIPVLPIEEPDNSLSMGDEHLDTIPATESDEVIKSSVEDLVQSQVSSECCHSNVINSSSDDDSPYDEDIDYVDASPPDVEIISLEVVEIVNPEVERIDDDILLTIKDDTLREKLLNVNLLIAKIDALRNNPTPSFDVVIKSTSTFSNPFLEETNTFDNSIPESETFRFNLEDFPDCEDSRFCPSLELHILSFILGIRYPNLID
ncbi:hypothetical protein Tco_1504830 [Tanacetum coccineum]